MANAYRDQNSVTTMIASSNTDGQSPVRLYADPVTHRLLVDTGGSSSGITSINSDTTAAQVLAVGATGTNFAIVDNGTGTHTFNLPVASATNTGKLSSTDWSTFNGKQASGNYITALTGDVTASGPGSVAATLATVNASVGSFTYASITVNAKGLVTAASSGSAPTGTVTTVSVATANGFAGTVANATTTPAITLTTSVTGILSGNGTAISAATTTGSGSVVLATSPTLITPVLGVATATSINKMAITAPATSSTLAVADGKTFTVNNTLTLAGTDSTTMTFPSTSAAIARTDAAQTFTGTQTFSQVLTTNNAITASANAATVPITSKINTVTNNSAATLTITLTTASATDGQLVIVRVLDFSAVAQTITWVNTENSSVSVPTTSNGSTTLPLTVGFQFNANTTKWRCIASA